MRKFGWKKSLPDHRHFKYAAHPEMQFKLTLPPLVDLRPEMSPIENQGELGSCVAHGTAANLEFLEMRDIKEKLMGSVIFTAGLFQPMSRLFIYWNARVIDGDPSQDGGTQVSSALQALKTIGVCSEGIWPYNPGNVFSMPTPDCFNVATRHEVLEAFKLDNTNIAQLKQCLALGFPFVFGITVYDSFMGDGVATTGIIPIPAMSESLLGGHCMCCVGYDDSKSMFIIRNSWGTQWGLYGYAYIPYDYLTSADLAADFWTIRK